MCLENSTSMDFHIPYSEDGTLNFGAMFDGNSAGKIKPNKTSDHSLL